MPTYVYACQACEQVIERRQSFHDDPLTECEECGGALRRVIQAPMIVFNRATPPPEEAQASAPAASEPSSTESPPAEAPKTAEPATSAPAESTPAKEPAAVGAPVKEATAAPKAEAPKERATPSEAAPSSGEPSDGKWHRPPQRGSRFTVYR